MTIPTIFLGSLPVSRLILGSNPFSGFSHQSPALDSEMMHYYSSQKIKETLALAERFGVTTLIGRADAHMARLLAEYWDEGGKIQWVAQTCTEFGMPLAGALRAIKAGASAVYIHGGQMDFLMHHDMKDEVQSALDAIHAAGLPAGVAAHMHTTQLWSADHFDFEFHMCSYYNPSDRTQFAGHKSGITEVYAAEDRDNMVSAIAQLPKPAIHYKIFAAGRNDPVEAFKFVAKHLRPTDAVCVGVFLKHKPDMLEEDIRLFESICLK